MVLGLLEILPLPPLITEFVASVVLVFDSPLKTPELLPAPVLESPPITLEAPEAVLLLPLITIASAPLAALSMPALNIIPLVASFAFKYVPLLVGTSPSDQYCSPPLGGRISDNKATVPLLSG